MDSLELRREGDCVLVPVRVQPKASRSAVLGVIEGELKVAVKAPPVDGAANKELLRFLGRKVLGVAPSRLRIVRGAGSRRKSIAVEGLTEAEVRRRLSD